MSVFWIYRNDQEDWQWPKAEQAVLYQARSLPSQLCGHTRNLGFVMRPDQQFWGIFSLYSPSSQENSEIQLRWLRRFKRPLTKHHLIRFGLLSLLEHATHMPGLSVIRLKKYEYKRVYNILENINHVDEAPLSISVLYNDSDVDFLVRSDAVSPDLYFRMEKDKESLRRQGIYLNKLKQDLQDVSGQAGFFDEAYNSLIRTARSVTATLFANGEGWRLFPQRNVMLANARHGFFPWEILTFADYTLALERNFSRLQQWNGQDYVGDRLIRKRPSKKIGFFDGLQNESSYAEYKLVQQIASFLTQGNVDYITLNQKDDLYHHFAKYDIVHLAVHGLIRDDELFIQINGQDVLLKTGEISMPYPYVLIAHVCSSALQQIIKKPSFPGHHVLVPDVNVQGGGQNSFLQAFYMQMLKNQKFSVAVKAGRHNALQAKEDPFAFVYYGNGSQTLSFFD